MEQADSPFDFQFESRKPLVVYFQMETSAVIH